MAVSLRNRPPIVWFGLAIGLAVYIYVRAQGAPLVGSTIGLVLHIWAVLWLHDQLTETCAAPACDAAGTVEVDGHSFCASHYAEFQEAVEEADQS